SELEKAHAEHLVNAQERAQKIEGLLVQIIEKAGPDGKLFGSVNNADIAKALHAQGFTVDKSAIKMPQGLLKQIGDFPVIVALHSDVTATITVSVLGATG